MPPEVAPTKTPTPKNAKRGFTSPLSAMRSPTRGRKRFDLTILVLVASPETRVVDKYAMRIALCDGLQLDLQT